MVFSVQQLKTKIRNLAAQKSADPIVLLRHYMMERFLERVANSRYSIKFILKGGVLVTSMVGFEWRSTMDIDATVVGEKVSIEEVQRMINEIVRIHLQDGVSFQVGAVSEIMQDAVYPGVRVSMEAIMDGMHVHIKIDFSTGGVITPNAVEYSNRLMFKDCAIQLMAYNLETVLAEKLETILTRTAQNTRMRDFYDAYSVFKIYRDRISPAILNKALTATAAKRGTLDRMQDADRIINELRNSKKMNALWDNYRARFSYAGEIEWETILNAVSKLAELANAQQCK